MSSGDKEATSTSSDHAEASQDDGKETGSNTAETWTESSFDEETSLPLLKYSKFLGVPRKPSTSEGSTTAASGALLSKCTSSAVAQVLILPASAPTAINATTEGAAMSSSNAGVPVASLSQSRGPLSSEEQNLLSSDLWKQPHLIMAAGWSSGKVSLISVANGMPVAVAGTDTTNPTATTEGMLPIRGGPTADPAPTVDVSFDSSGTTLAAVDSGGTCCIWDFRFSASWKRKPSSATPSSGSPTRPAATPAATPAPSAGGQNTGMFSSFMSALTGLPPTAESAPSSEPAPTTPTADTDAGQGAKIPCLAASISQVSRISYPTNWKSPTVVVLDPAHRKKSSKYLVVGFQDGRLMLTKRPGLFQRRSDVTLYQGTGGKEASSYRGVECVAWRGNLIAWADVGGIKVLDAETLTRIAHIDRPTGARAALYPTLTSLSPHLLFETSQSLLVAWGDCLMSMHIQEQLAPAEGTAVGVRRTVECTMAWELAGMVASGVTPLDANHILVVGVVTPEEIDGDEEMLDSSSPVALDQNAPTGQNELEIQIISRHDGTVQYADVLPMESIHSAADFRLLSSFALQRMDNNSEWEEYRNWAGIAGEFDDFDLTLLASPSGDSVPDSSSADNVGGGTSQPNASTTFVDSHLQWDLKSSLFEGVDEPEEVVQDEIDDTASVDSDDYGFVLRPLIPKDELNYSSGSALPPEMILTTPDDVLHMSLFTVDDAVEHALVTQNRPAVALQRALTHRRQLRRFNISDLVQSYLEAVLQLSPEYNYGEKLSLRRMKLAIQAMPVILGGHTVLWTKWVEQLEKLPGALFILRSYLPVRDPILPPLLYENVLKGMLDELGKFQLDSNEDNKVVEEALGKLDLQQEAAGHFLESILAWGPTKALKEFIKLYQYSRRRGDKSVSDLLRRLEMLLRRRYLQTSACYLQFPVAEEHSLLATNAPQYNVLKDDSQDALFEVNKFLQFVSEPLTQESRTLSKTEQHVYLEAFARLKVMQGQYEVALQAYLYMGVTFSPVPMEELESWAIDTVQAGEESLPRRSIQINGTQYDFVLGLVENQHLHRLLLDSGFLAKSTPEVGALKVSPLFALLQLVGLDRVGDFLVEHCVSTERSDQYGSQLDRESSETIPIDLVARQLKSSPPLMYWYLNLLFMRRQELYVKFPRNAIPPASVTELHRQHFQLLIDFAGDFKDSVKALAGTETYKIESKATPLLSFLKAALPLGGISPIDARRELETIRSEDVDPSEGAVDFVSSSFALELAYIIEHYTDLNAAEAVAVLDMYLKGTNSIMLGVAYAQRRREYSSMLWDKMIEFCLNPGESKVRASNGMLFGELLEAAALSGADLALTVSNIPPGMVVEGLRPRLVAAVADYRLKLGIHEAAAAAAEEEKVSLMRETAHRSKRGARFEFYPVPSGPPSLGSDTRTRGESGGKETDKDGPLILPRTLRPIQRKDRRTLSYSLPMSVHGAGLAGMGEFYTSDDQTNLHSFRLFHFFQHEPVVMSSTPQLPHVSADGTVEFSLAAIHPHLICDLCNGYYRDPYTITDCLHTFCKSCLFYAVACGCNECPTCHVFMGSDPSKVAVLDRNLTELIDKVVFPTFVEQESHEEDQFYQRRGIARKDGSKQQQHESSKERSNPPTSTYADPDPSTMDEEMECSVLPAVVPPGQRTLPKLEYPCLTVSGRLRMSQLKRYILQQMPRPSPEDEEAGIPETSEIEILCNGVPLGDEISLSFVKRLLWQHDEHEPLLTYQWAENR